MSDGGTAGRKLTGVVAIAAAVVVTLAAPAGAQGVLSLDNGSIKIGVDTTKGGAIVLLQPSGTAGAAQNVVNSFDLGREIQQSYYAGPSDFQPAGTTQNPSWSTWPWNPVQAGDSYGNASAVVTSSTTGGVLYTKTIPKQWALQNVPSECTIEQWITLSGSVATVRNRLTNARADTTQYSALQQELPAVYTRATLTTLKTYAGTQPFTGGTISTMPNSPPPSWGTFRGTEGWAAFVNGSDWGLGVVLPGNVNFKGGFYTSGTATGTSSPSAGYIAPIRSEVIDHDIVYDYTYSLVLGTVSDIRAFAVANKPDVNPDYQFQGTRAGWTYLGAASDTGFPIGDHLTVNINGSDPQMLGPECTFQATNVPKLYVRAAYSLASGTSTTAQFFWERNNGASPISATNSKTFSVVNDGQYRIYEVDLSATSSWTGQISRLRFDPTTSATAGSSIDIQSISAYYPTTIPIDVASGTQTQAEARNAYLSGTFGVMKTGTGTLTLTSSNGYTGDTQVTAGVLQLGHSAAIVNSTLDTLSGTAGGVSFGTLTSATFGGLAGSKGLVLTNSATTPAGVALTVGGNGRSTTFAGGLSGLGSLTKTGTGTLVLAGSNSLATPYRVTGGQLELGVTNALGGTATLVMAPTSGTATLDLNGFSQSLASLTTSGSGGVAVIDSTVASGVATLSVGAGNLNETFAGRLQNSVTGGSLALTKVGTGTMTLTGGDSAFAGTLVVNGGRLVVNPGVAGRFAATGKLQMAAGSGANVALEIVSGSNAFSSAGISAIGDASGTSTLEVKGGTTTVTVSASRFLVGNKGRGQINVSAGSLTMSGTNEITLGGDSVYALNNASGVITVTGGTLSVTGTGVFRMGVNITGTTTGAQGTVNLNGGAFETARAFTLGTGSGTVNFNGGTLRALASSTNFLAVTSANVLAGGARFDTNGHAITVAQALSGTGGLMKLGSGTLNLAGANTFSGSTTISQGTLKLAAAGALASSTVTVAAGATLAVGPQVQATVPRMVNNGQVDVGLGTLTVAGGLTATGVTNQILAGIVNGGTTGITSSNAAPTGGAFTVGWVDNFDGSFTCGYAAAGDTNLDNVVDLTDLLSTVGGGAYDNGATANWSQGDFNYDGVSDLTDLLSLVGGGLYDKPDYNPVSRLLLGMTPTISAGETLPGVATVPEPGALVLVGLGAACLRAAALRRGLRAARRFPSRRRGAPAP